jgi:predicted GNAT family acetyltransferase
VTDLSLTLVPTNKNRARLLASRDGDELGSMTIAFVHQEGLIIEHTLIGEQSRGQGVGQALFDHVVAWARKSRLYVVPVCPFVLSRFEQLAETNDVRATCRLQLS